MKKENEHYHESTQKKTEKKQNWARKFWRFLKKDTWQSWVVSLIIAFVFIKFVFFPILSWGLATPLPLVVVESCSMYHNAGFDSWWQSNAGWYENRGIKKPDFREYGFKGGLNKGDIVLITGRTNYEVGDVIVFESGYKFPLIHRLVRTDPYDTKGDNNPSQLPGELGIEEEQILGKALFKIPGLGWTKLIFFESLKPQEQRGLCK